MNMTNRVAIVSFAGRFPGSGADLARYWQNIATATDCSSEVPTVRWALPPERCRDPRIAHPDHVYSTRGYYLEPFEPDLDGLLIDRELISQLDPLFHLVLDVGNRAWRAAKMDQIDRARVGVVLGNICLPTDRSSELCRQILGRQFGLSHQAPHPWNRYVAGLPAGLLAKGLGLGAGSYTLDAACASSLFALKLAADELLAGRADAMLAGGCSRPDCQYTQMGFAQLRALSTTGRCSPFDKRADGLMVGEGASIFVLKRLSDALAQGDTILAVIAGVGLSNDLHGNLLAPAKEGQLRAMRQAYEQAQWQPQDVDLIECHATGTPVGDAIEFASLCELWEPGEWKAGQCVIGSVKSTVGHLLTGAGAAALAKVVLALQAKQLPPQTNFTQPLDTIPYHNSPFRILGQTEPWETRRRNQARRAAVSGFGFGGINAHLLLEEWTESSAHPSAISVSSKPVPVTPVAIVGLAVHFGPWGDLRRFQEQVLSGRAGEPQPKRNGWGLATEACPPAFGIETLKIPTDRFRIPPKELEEMLPQQLLMLQVAAAALADVRNGANQPQPWPSSDPRSGVVIGLGLDPNTMNFHLRWSILAAGAGDPEAASPPLTANRTMGALGSITASRIARAFGFGGPSHTVCSEQASAARAVELGVRALQKHELDRVLVGAVDLACDPRLVLPGQITCPGEGAGAFVLKRLADAERDGDRIYAVIQGLGVASDPARARAQAGEGVTTAIEFDAKDDIGDAGAASAAASLAKAALALWHEILPGPPPQYWLHDCCIGPRRAMVTATSVDGTHYAIVLEENRNQNNRLILAGDRRQPLGPRTEAIFVVRGQSSSELIAGLERLCRWAESQPHQPIERLARQWFRQSSESPPCQFVAAIVSRNVPELVEQTGFLVEHLRTTPHDALPVSAKPALRDRVFYRPQPLGPQSQIALVFPGSGNQFDGMGRDLSVHWPEILRRQQSENELLRSQFKPEVFWNGRVEEATHRELMFGQVTVGALVHDLLVTLGIHYHAMIGLSLGESAGLFAIRVWRDRDEMFRRMQESTLFVSDLAPPHDAARHYWSFPISEPAGWVSGLIAARPEEVMDARRPDLKAYLLIINTPNECVIGGREEDVQELARALGKPVTLLTGVTLAHCEVGHAVEDAYRQLHTLPVYPLKDVQVYSGAWGKPYAVSDRACAESITAGLLNTINVPALIEAAYEQGIRVFIEVGPGSSCTRMIEAILGDRPHLARAAHVAKQDAVSQILRLMAQLIAEGLPVNLAALYGPQSDPLEADNVPTTTGHELVVPVGQVPRATTSQRIPAQALSSLQAISPSSVESVVATQLHTIQAQAAFLRVNQQVMESVARLLRFQTQLLTALIKHPGGITVQAHPEASQAPLPNLSDPPRSLNYEQCCQYAVGKIGDVLGPRYSEIDQFPTRVRLPDGPLQLVDRIILIEGEPLSMTRGRVVTEHTVHQQRWYLEFHRIPTALAVEAGQADLFLSGFLGIDFQTRGLAVYRLLDAVVTFHRGLPRVGETIRYDIHIDQFTKQGEVWLFHFHFDGTVNGQPFITMRNGVAGFFTAEALAAGKGIVQTAFDKQPQPGKRPADWCDWLPQRVTTLTSAQVDALRAGDLVTAFGDDFAALPIRQPATLPGGMLKLLDRVPLLDPQGGRFGLGFVRGEFDIQPDDWFLKCHFVDDQVMPGTLMYECCLHTLRVFLLRMGWVGETGRVSYEPVPGVESRLKCRGQVIASTHTVTYEVTIKELGYRPEPYCLADALMYADGKPIVEITNMSTRLVGLTRDDLEALWGWTSPLIIHEKKDRRRYDSASILAFSNGKPSEAFGEPYRVFDSERVIARLPGPPFQFLDSIEDVTGEPFVLQAGASCVAQYAVPSDAWYFEANRCSVMPFAVLLEIALQPCGWLAAYCGSALTSPDDLSFRNLGGRATQFRAVTPDTGLLTTRVKLTNVSRSAGMIIQHFDMQVCDRLGPVYEGTTYFGFFTQAQLAHQVGIRDAKVPWPSETELLNAQIELLPHDPPFPAPMLRMVDHIRLVHNGGRKGLGLVVGSIRVDPEFWFFKAHFYQDPVWPGSLGLESFLQLLKLAAWKRWGPPSDHPWQTVALNQPHCWLYRGQVLPTDREVTIVLELTEVDDQNQRLTANGFLLVDGRVIYQMTDFTLE